MKEDILSGVGLSGAATTTGLTLEPVITSSTASDVQIVCTVAVAVVTVISLIYSMILKRERLQDDREHNAWMRKQQEQNKDA